MSVNSLTTCGCGCGQEMMQFDKRGRIMRFIDRHRIKRKKNTKCSFCDNSIYLGEIILN